MRPSEYLCQTSGVAAKKRCLTAAISKPGAVIAPGKRGVQMSEPIHQADPLPADFAFAVSSQVAIARSEA